jgi:RNA polymerase sigma-70 factor (ECF subfamily)
VAEELGEHGSPPGAMMAAPAARFPVSDVDRARLERIFNQHYATVWRVLMRRGLTADAAADATQETYLLAAQKLVDIRLESERAFLIGTAIRVAHSLGRKTVRWTLAEDMDRYLSNARDAGEMGEDLQLCDRVLSQVDAALIEVFVLYELEGLTSPEIAESLQIPLGTVASRLHRAREQFREAAKRIRLSLEREGRHERPPR